MSNFPYQETLNIALEPEVLANTFKIQTNWHVIAGAPSAGKTTLIELFGQRGFNTAPEPPRLYMDAEFAKGRTIQEIRQDQKKLQHTFFKLQLDMESQLNPDDVIFLDRGIPDQFSYCRIAGVNPNKFVKDCFRRRYQTVFILAPLPFDKDGYRDPEAEIVDYFDEWTTRDYRALGYPTVRVPILSLEDRMNFILEKLSL
jgi:predicted ATPase